MVARPTTNLATRVWYPAGFTFFFFFCLAPFTMYQNPVIDHCPWPSSPFNKWHAQNVLLSSSFIHCHREQPLVHSPLTPASANHCRRKACFVKFLPYFFNPRGSHETTLYSSQVDSHAWSHGNLVVDWTEDHNGNQRVGSILLHVRHFKHSRMEQSQPI
jgi:hypothetical protein